jgi:hypothetical protein
MTTIWLSILMVWWRMRVNDLNGRKWKNTGRREIMTQKEER